jgi:hypothetical protein
MMRSQLLLPALFLYMLLLTFFLQVWLKRRQRGLSIGVARRPWGG